MPSGRKKTAHRDLLPSWVWMLLGAGLGMAAAFLIYAGFRPGPARTVPADPPRAHAAQGASHPKASPAPGSDAADRFDFYEVLPRFKVVVPGAKPPKTAGTARTPATAPADAGGTYVLQIGSFRALKDADRLQARLALLGVEAEIQHVAVNDQTWHRVRVGPSSDLAKMDRIRQRLRNAQIGSVLLRVQ